MGRLEYKVALITGGARGIGRAIVERFAAEGACVVVADRSLAAATAVADAIGPSAKAVEVDVASLTSVRDAVRTARAAFGSIDVLVNSAGAFDMQPLLDIEEASFNHLQSINVNGTLFMLQEVARTMVDEGRPGIIINMASQAGHQGEPRSAAYAATKAAVISLTRSAALALVRKGIRVNAIAPGIINTPMWDQVDASYARQEGIAVGDHKRQVTSAIPLGRMGEPEDVAFVAVFLACDDSRYMIGQTINVDGGNMLT